MKQLTLRNGEKVIFDSFSTENNGGAMIKHTLSFHLQGRGKITFESFHERQLGAKDVLLEFERVLNNEEVEW